jgi:chemotaxis protein MotA
MIAALGIVCVILMVFGGYALAGGKLYVVFAALPYEMIIIGGAAVGAFLIANSGSEAIRTLRDLIKVFRPPKWRKDDYTGLLCLLHDLMIMYREDPVSLEAEIEEPSASALFQKYPRLLSNHAVVSAISDTFRVMQMTYVDPHQLDELIGERIESFQEEDTSSSKALQVMADGLPALGIVAAVLGVIKTMSSVDQPPEILGGLIGSALVGTFVGVFLAYGLVGPLSSRLRSIAGEEAGIYSVVKYALVSLAHDHPPKLCLEIGRQMAPENVRPGFSEVEEALVKT